MNHYETVYVVHPAIQEGRLNDIVTKFHNKLSKLKGEVLYIENWGKKKLAYAIDKQKYGTYILCQYAIGGEYVKEVSQELELNPNILRYLITKIESSDVKEGSNQLEIKEKNDPPKTEEPVSIESQNKKIDTKESSEEKPQEENIEESANQDNSQEEA
tara:strand:+ start:50 stop:523 length:474 start_codon:yes stop_codon:yes gene_type:complete